MTTRRSDIDALRSLAERYASIAARPVQDERRALWASHHGLRSTRVPVLVNFGWHNTWAREHFGPQIECKDPLFRNVELILRMKLLHDEVGDDTILEPCITTPCAFKVPYGIFGEAYGVRRNVSGTTTTGVRGRPTLLSGRGRISRRSGHPAIRSTRRNRRRTSNDSGMPSAI